MGQEVRRLGDRAVGVVAGSPLGARLAARHGAGPVSGVAMLVIAGTFLANLTYDLHTSLALFCAVGLVSGLAVSLA